MPECRPSRRYLISLTLAVSIVVLTAACSSTSGETIGADPDIIAAAATADETFDESYLNARGSSRFPSLDDPVLIAGSTATWIKPDDVVMGIVSDSGEAQAYPVNQMIYHHVANTRLAGEPFVVTY